MNLNNNVQEKTGVQKLAEKFKNYVKTHYSVILLMTIGFLAASAINFFNVATGRTIASFNLEDFDYNFRLYLERGKEYSFDLFVCTSGNDGKEIKIVDNFKFTP